MNITYKFSKRTNTEDTETDRQNMTFNINASRHMKSKRDKGEVERRIVYSVQFVTQHMTIVHHFLCPVSCERIEKEYAGLSVYGTICMSTGVYMPFNLYAT